MRFKTTDLRSAAGFTLLEVLIVGAIVGTLLATSVMVLPSVVNLARADSGSSELMAALRTARERAITERRNMTVTFVAPNIVEVRRDELSVNAAGDIVVTGTTLVSETAVSQGMEFRRFGADVPDTPDGFAPIGDDIEFTGGEPWQFTAEGTLVSQSGDVVNGTVFMGRVNDPLTARAVTLFGATALLRDWSWNGAAWVD